MHKYWLNNNVNRKYNDEKTMGMDEENYSESVKLTWLTCLFNEGFSQPICKASLIFSWKGVEAVSRIEKHSSEHKDLHASDPLMCWKICEFLWYSHLLE